MGVVLPEEYLKVAAVVLNLGLKSIRAIAFGANGEKLASAARPVHTVLRDEFIEQDPEEWWSRGVECLREVEQFTGPEVSMITVTASSACLVPVGTDGAPLRQAIMVSDRRAHREAEALGEVPEYAVISQQNASFAADPYFMVPKAMWYRAHEPELWQRTAYLLTPADFLVQRLCGVVATDPLNAEKYYAIDSQYPAALLDAVGIPQKLLPAIKQIGSELGTLTPAASAATRLSARTRVVLSTYDAICAFWGSGVSAIGDVADVSGTVTSVRALVQSALPPQERRVFSQSVPGIDAVVAGGSNNLGGGLIEWLKQTFYPGEELAYERIESEASKSAPSASGLLFLPYLLGERCPVWDTEARGVLLGLERHHSRGDIARAVLEGAAFSVKHILDTVSEHGFQFQRIRVSGGLARISLINQIKADVTGLPIEVVAEFETTALGAFILAGVGVGHFASLAEGSRIAKVREIILPDSERHDLYQEWFTLYLDSYKALRPLFRERLAFKERRLSRGVGRLENL